MTSSPSRSRWPISAPRLQMRWHRGRPGSLGEIDQSRHCEEQSDEAIQSSPRGGVDCFASLAMTAELRIPQQPLDVIEFDLRALGIGEAAAEFFQDPAYPLHIDFTGNLHRQIIAEFTPVQRTSQRIALIAAALLTACAGAGAVALAFAIALLHRFSEALGALAQGFQCLPLRINGAVGVTLAELAAGIAHRAIGLTETILAIARIAVLALLALLAFLALLTLLPLLAALALPHAALGKLVLQFPEAVAQALLILLQIAHALIALLAALAVAP